MLGLDWFHICLGLTLLRAGWFLINDLFCRSTSTPFASRLRESHDRVLQPLIKRSAAIVISILSRRRNQVIACLTTIWGCGRWSDLELAWILDLQSWFARIWERLGVGFRGECKYTADAGKLSRLRMFRFLAFRSLARLSRPKTYAHVCYVCPSQETSNAPFTCKSLPCTSDFSVFPSRMSFCTCVQLSFGSCR